MQVVVIYIIPYTSHLERIHTLFVIMSSMDWSFDFNQSLIIISFEVSFVYLCRRQLQMLISLIVYTNIVAVSLCRA